MPEAAETLSTADRALIRALRAWGGDDVDLAWSRLSPGRREKLAGLARRLAARESIEDAWDALRRDHIASTRPDPARVHPTWFVRALKGESPAVRLAVAAHAPPEIRGALRIGLGLDPETIDPPARPADPEALRWALDLWAERIVGDAAERPDDPPVVYALAHLDGRDLARLVKVAGLAKHAFAIESSGPSAADEALACFGTADRVRLAYFRRQVGKPDARLVPLARLDLESVAGERRRFHSRLGLLTFGRLLAAAESHRARWAVQHLPYPIARSMRVREKPPLPARALAAWEGWILEAAWSRLLNEGWLSGENRRGKR